MVCTLENGPMRTRKRVCVTCMKGCTLMDGYCVNNDFFSLDALSELEKAPSCTYMPTDDGDDGLIVG